MPEEYSDEVEDQDAPDKADTDSVEHDTQQELPTDPVALRQLAEETQKKLADERRESRRLKRETERLSENLTEQTTKADYWSTEAQRQQSQPAAENTAKKADKASFDDEIENAVKDLSLDDYVTEDKGMVKLAKDLAQRVIEPLINRKLKEQKSEDEQVNTRDQQAYQEVGQLYPELADRNSDLSKETFAEMNKIAAEKPHLTNPERLEMAASRAAARIGYVKGKPKAAPNGNDQGRLNNAKGGPPNRNGGGGGAVLTVTDYDRKMARKVTGENQSDAWILQNKQEVAARNKGR